MPCGYDLDRARQEAGPLVGRSELRAAKAFYAAGANAYFSRPGPRLVDGVEALAAALHPEIGLRSAPDAVSKMR